MVDLSSLLSPSYCESMIVLKIHLYLGDFRARIFCQDAHQNVILEQWPSVITLVDNSLSSIVQRREQCVLAGAKSPPEGGECTYIIVVLNHHHHPAKTNYIMCPVAFGRGDEQMTCISFGR